MRARIDAAISRYLEVIGDGAIQPRRASSTEMLNGLVILRNVAGMLALVAPSGAVFDRIGGQRLDDGAELS